MKKKENTSRQTAFHRIATTALSLLFLTTVQAQRESKTINDSWKFLQGECPTAIDSAFNDANWTSVHLPHTWNTDAYTEKDYYREQAGIAGKYQYRKVGKKNRYF